MRIGPDHVEVVDDGRGTGGVSPAGGPAVNGDSRTAGHGLSGLRARAGQAGATLSVGAGDGGRGFRLRLDAGATP